jgi:hypothetical protein
VICREVFARDSGEIADGRSSTLAAVSDRLARGAGAFREKTFGPTRMAADGGLIILNTPTTSPTRCCASAGEEPEGLFSSAHSRSGMHRRGQRPSSYEFGVKVSVVGTFKQDKGGQCTTLSRCQANPYDGHTLAAEIPDMEALVGNTIKRAFADKGYRGHNAPTDYWSLPQVRGGGLPRRSNTRCAGVPAV